MSNTALTLVITVSFPRNDPSKYICSNSKYNLCRKHIMILNTKELHNTIQYQDSARKQHFVNGLNHNLFSIKIVYKELLHQYHHDYIISYT